MKDLIRTFEPGTLEGVFLTVSLVALGLVVGKILNAVIYRVPRGEAIVWRGSHCPVCGHALRIWDRLPLFNVIFPKGRCFNCRTVFFPRSRVVELLTGILFAFVGLSGLKTGISPERVLLNLIFISGLIALSFIDLKTFRLPDVLTLPLLVLGLTGAFLLPGNPTGWESLLSAVGSGSAFLMITLLYPQGMGLGDVKLVAVMGAFLGFPYIFLAVFVGSFFGLLMGLVFLFTEQKHFHRQIPFGPSLALGSVLTLLWGTQILRVYGVWIG